MFHPSEDGGSLEWVELFNALSYDMDISGWELDGGIEFTFPNGTTIPGDGYLVVAKSPAALEAQSGITNVYGPFEGQLSNGGETIRLENNSDRVMDALSYEDGGDWPVAPDGSGVSLSKINPVSASDLAENWHPGPMQGTPGEANFLADSSSSQHILLARDSIWKYRDLGTDPGSSWMQTNYLDSSWASGPADLGYNLNGADPTTIVSYGPNASDKYPTTYFRIQFSVTDAGTFSDVTLHHLIDDGAVFYLNGTELSPRIRMDAGPVSYLDHSSSSVADAFWDSFSVPPGLVVEGQNTLAVEIHQTSATSSDINLNAEMVATIVNQTTNSNAQLLEPPELVLNEIPGVTNTAWWIELKNTSDSSLDIDGYRIAVADDPAREYVLSGPPIPANDVRLVTDTELGFSALDEEPIFLYRPDTNSVVDARVATRSLRGRNGTDWQRPALATPGAANQFALTTDIVINEIMYHHQATNDGVAYAESDEEWIELYNRGTGTVDLTGWAFDDGIDYAFLPAASLAPDGYLVVSNFSGSLSDRGERLRLVDAAGNPADEVRYFDGGRWPESADGDGASMELRDPFADNSVPEAWAASDEEPKSNWQTYSYETVASSSSVGPDGVWDELVVGLLDAGEVLLDDISVIEDPAGSAIEFISTSDFESGLGDWRIIGNHRHSEVITDPDNAANQVLRLVASGATEHMHNHAEITLANGQQVNNGTTYQISFRAKWITGSRLLNTRLYFNRAAQTVVLDAPMNNGTPGTQNSTFTTNAGPTFAHLRHDPIVPQPAEPVTISIQADDVHGVQLMTTWYSVDGGSWQSSAMTVGSNSLYSVTLPALPASSIVHFYVEAEDTAGATSTFPARGANARALYKVDDGLGSATLHNFRIIMTPADAEFLDTDIQLMSNEQLGCTVIFDDRDIYYDVGVRYKGSERGRVSDGRLGFRCNFHPEQPFNGVHESIAIDRSAQQNVSQREMLINQIMNRGGGALSKYTDLIQVVAPKVEHTSPAELYLARFGDVYLDAQFEAGSDGTVFEYEIIYHPTTTNGAGYKLPSPDSVKGTSITDLGDDKEDYRWNFLIKNNRAKDDYAPLIVFAKTMGLSGTAFNQQIGDVVDVDHWLRYMAYAVANGHSDNYSSGSKHNAMFYMRPTDGRAVYLPHDMDLSHSTTRPLVPNNDLQKMIGTPERERLYYGHMWDILQTVYNTGYMQTWTDRLGALLPGENFGSYLTFIGNRHTFLVGELNARVAPSYPFTITVSPTTVSTLSATVSGNGWLDVYQVFLSGSDTPLALSWTAAGSGASRTYSWSAEVPLNAGQNVLTFLAYNFQGELVGTETVIITSTATGNPLQDHLRVTELMHSPMGGSDYEFVELCNTGSTNLDLSGVTFSDGIEFDFSASGFTSLDPQTHCVIVRDLTAFSSRYDTTNMIIAGIYSGKLSDGETVEIRGALDEELLKFEYQSGWGWPLAARDSGHSIVPVDDAVPGQSQGSLDYGGNWRASAGIHGSPGQADVVTASPIRLNEVVAHTDYSHPSHPEYDSNDLIELYNTTTNAVTIGADWYLSDDGNQLDKWNIPPSTVIPPHGLITFDEVTGFHAPITSGFGLDKSGEQVFLSYLPTNGTRFVADTIRFKGQENGASLARYHDGSSFWYTHVPTPDMANPIPPLHPVITEIMYNPDSARTNTIPDEYIEIRNPTDAPVALWNEAGSWRIAGGIDYDFPTNTTLNAEENLLLVSFDPADTISRDAFLALYGVSTGAVRLAGPFSSALDNRGERVVLERPQPGDQVGDPVSWVVVDEVIYFHQAPWPASADGTGQALQRKHTRWSGNGPNNWYASFSPSPGQTAELYGSAHVPDWWMAEANLLWTNNFELIANDDPDLDGLTTAEEYIAGTDPLSSGSTLGLEIRGLELRIPTVSASDTYNGRERYYIPLQTDNLTTPFTAILGLGDILGDDQEYIYPIPAETNGCHFYRVDVNLR